MDGGILSSASVAGLLVDLELTEGNRYSVTIFVYTLANVAFSLPATLAVRLLGPRKYFALILLAFGILVIVSLYMYICGRAMCLETERKCAVYGVCPHLEGAHRFTDSAGDRYGKGLAASSLTGLEELMVLSFFLGGNIPRHSIGDFDLVYKKYVASHKTKESVVVTACFRGAASSLRLFRSYRVSHTRNWQYCQLWGEYGRMMEEVTLTFPS